MRNPVLLQSCIEGLIRLEDRCNLARTDQADWLCDRLKWHKLLALAAALNNPGKSKCTVLEKKLREVHLSNIRREHHYMNTVRYLFSILEKNAVDFIPYKGPFWSSRIYPEFNWSHIGDIDVIMKKEDARFVSSLLQQENYTPVIVKGSEENDFLQRGELTMLPPETAKCHIPIQIHWELLPSHRFIRTGFITWNDFLDGSSPATWKDVSYRLPRAEMRFLFYLLHGTCQHQFKRFAHLLISIHCLIKNPVLDWNSMYDFARDRQCIAPLYYGLKLIRYFHTLPDPALELMGRINIPLQTRIPAGFLQPGDLIRSTESRGKYKRKLFRVAMSW